MFSSGQLIGYARVLVLFGAVTGAVLLLGPFESVNERMGLSDPVAHALAFYVLTLGLFVSAPTTRRTDLALVAAAVAIGSELAQPLTGRSADLRDLIFDAVGIFAAVAPALAERLRRHYRAHPELPMRPLWSKRRPRR